MVSETNVLLDGLVFGEGPRWHDERLWFSDMHAHQVMAVDLSGRSDIIVRVLGQPSGLGWLPDGRLLVVSMADRRTLFILTAESSVPDVARARSSGRVEIVEVDVPGAGLP
jgi:sugar lactone lactonase YvrE